MKHKTWSWNYLETAALDDRPGTQWQVAAHILADMATSGVEANEVAP